VENLATDGIKHLKLRMLDLDPTSYVGIRTGTLRFIRLLASYFIMSPALNKSEVSEALAVADKRNEIVALEDPTKKSQL
jgi:glutamate--cysteine ligase